jgi:hypothetical protein
MKRTISVLALASTLGFGMQAFADEPPADQTAPPSSQSMTSDESMSTDQTTTVDQQKFMKDCMAKAKTANNGMSQKDMKKSCTQQYKTSLGQPQQPVTPAH